jgi:uncharacterized UBP type Zn finger protein
MNENLFFRVVESGHGVRVCQNCAEERCSTVRPRYTDIRYTDTLLKT